jgi:hypothetical protein
MEEADLAFWLDASPDERVASVLQLNEELRSLRDDDDDLPRLQRAVGGVRPRRR